MRRTALIGWSASTFTGWGVYGVNLALAWVNDPEVQPIFVKPVFREEIALDPLRDMGFRRVWSDSEGLQARLKTFGDRTVDVNGTLLVALNDSFVPGRVPGLPVIRGKPNIGVAFFETAQLEPEAVARAADYAVIVAGSTWNADVLHAHGVRNATTILQGVDTTLFHPAVRNGWLSDRFLIFSGGKLEHRKGQDIVLAAFRTFARRHPEALLVTAWHSPWPEVASSLDSSGLCAPVAFVPGGRDVDVPDWAEASGVRRDQVLDLGRVPNSQMPQLLREMDLAAFASRCEGGTNLVAMEAMACGVPVILSANTGHLDLIEDDNAYVLRDQKPVEGKGAGYGRVGGWGESRVDELVDAMEQAFGDRTQARRRGLAGAAKLAEMSWAATAQRMKALVLSTPAP